MSVVTVCNHKGGTGKTTTSIHVAAAMGLAGQRVLLVDFDPQGFLTRLLGMAEPPPERSSLALLAPDADLRAFPVEAVGDLRVIGASQGLTRALRQLTKPTDVLWLRDTLRAGHDYDVILLDTAAALSVFTMNALAASDLVVIPVTPEYQPVVGAEQTWQTCGVVHKKLNPGMATPRFLLTQVDARLSRHGRYAEYLRQKYGAAVLPTPIRTSSSLAGAVRDGQTVFDQRPAPRGALDYAAATDDILAAIGAGGHVPLSAMGIADAPTPTANELARPPASAAPSPAPPPNAAPPAGAWTTLDRL